MRRFDDIAVGDAFRINQSIYIKIKDTDVSNSICLNTGHSCSIVKYAVIERVELAYQIVGVDLSQGSDNFAYVEKRGGFKK